jgi:hypothetical protein
VIIGGRALLTLIAARFSGSGSGKDLLGRAISLIASDLLPFSSFPTPALFSGSRFHPRFAGTRIPTLAEVLDWAKRDKMGLGARNQGGRAA